MHKLRIVQSKRDRERMKTNVVQKGKLIFIKALYQQRIMLTNNIHEKLGFILVIVIPRICVCV